VERERGEDVTELEGAENGHLGATAAAGEVAADVKRFTLD